MYGLSAGVGHSDRPDAEVETLDRVLRGRPIVDTTASIARRAGRIDGQLRRDGERLSTSDLIIGAKGLPFDEPVLTGNVDDFERIPGVAVETY